MDGARVAADEVASMGELIGQRADAAGPAFVEGATGRAHEWADVARRATGWAAVGPVLAVRPAAPDGGGTDCRARIGLLISDPLEMASTFLSALAAGVTVAPLDAAGARPELTTAVRTLGLSAVVGGRADLETSGEALRRAGVDLWAAGPAGPERVAARERAARTGAGGGAAVLLSSSGTTGVPKLIPLGLGALLHTARRVVSHHRLEPSDCGYSPLPLSHINGLVVGVLAALVRGHRLVVDRRFSASTFWDVVECNEVTWLNLVPAVISVLADRPPPDRGCSARVAFARSASAPLAVATLRRFERSTGVPVVETYGLTEAGSQVAANPRPPGSRRPGSVGVPVGVELRVVDGDHRPLPAGQVGQVQIRGESVVTEYWAPTGRSPATRPALDADGWLATGDLGRIDAGGYVYLAGRNDDVINRGGEKVYPREVEEVLLAETGVDAAAVVGRPHPTVGAEPVAFVVARAGTDRDALVARLRARCAAELSRFRRPAEFVLVDALPCGLNGKIRRAELRTMVASSRPGTSPGTSPAPAEPRAVAPPGRAVARRQRGAGARGGDAGAVRAGPTG